MNTVNFGTVHNEVLIFVAKNSTELSQRVKTYMVMISSLARPALDTLEA